RAFHVTGVQTCALPILSIFVNPLQFDREDDLARYPRTEDDDLAMCRSLGTDVVFLPPVAEVYPSAQLCTVDVSTLADHLCGRHRDRKSVVQGQRAERGG